MHAVMQNFPLTCEAAKEVAKSLRCMSGATLNVKHGIHANDTYVSCIGTNCTMTVRTHKPPVKCYPKERTNCA